MLKHLRPGDEVIVYKLDRLGRSIHHLIELVNLFESKKVGFRSLQDGIVLNDSPVSKMIFNIFASIAQFERDVISERTRDGLAAARKRGRIGGRPRGLSKEAKIKAKAAKSLYIENTCSVRDICEQLNIAIGTLYKYLRYENVKIGSSKYRTN